jgi:membrane-associated phospholipid phosphatase
VYAFSLYLPSSPWLLPFGAASYGLAGLAASFRVFSGMHFITDVIAGAALGAIAGYVIPLLHSKVAADVNGKGLALQATPTLLLIGYSY